MAVVVAPPSAIVQGGQQLQAGLQQAQTDLASLASLLSSWPPDVDTRLQCLVEIEQRLIEFMVLIAQGVASVANQVGYTL